MGKRIIYSVNFKRNFQRIAKNIRIPEISPYKNERFLIINDYILPYFEVVDVAEPLNNVCRDKNDDKFISCAISGDCDLIVSGDMDLLSLKSYKDVKIITPSEFLSICKI